MICIILNCIFAQIDKKKNVRQSRDEGNDISTNTTEKLNNDINMLTAHGNVLE